MWIKVRFSASKLILKIGKAQGTRLIFTKIKKSQPNYPTSKTMVGWWQSNNFLSPVYLKLGKDGKRFLEKIKKFYSVFCCLFHIFCMTTDLETSFINQNFFSSVKVWYIVRLTKYACKKVKKVKMISGLRIWALTPV